MSDFNTNENLENPPIDTVALLDCGQASKVTKGLPFLIVFELGLPPYDRALIL